jgi:uncharacterized protein (DUF1330 family)
MLGEEGGTMPAYVIFQGDVQDEALYEEYKPKAAASIAAAGGRFLVRGGPAEQLEGDPVAGRNVVIEFPDRESALSWYHGDAYAEARALRQRASVGRMVLVEGVSA